MKRGVLSTQIGPGLLNLKKFYTNTFSKYRKSFKISISMKEYVIEITQLYLKVITIETFGCIIGSQGS
jgi:hypothetical protein